MDKPHYKKKPIASINSLAKALSVDTDNLIQLANEADSLYRLYKRIEKANGSFREVYSVKYKLKIVQSRIHKRIFSNVYFPSYLHGSIKDPVAPRSYVTSAASHINASVSVNLDISNFFPSLKSQIIFDIWKRFFNFSSNIADLLTKLTTYNGCLPQGASTSPSLANLAFWREENHIVTNLNEKGFVYTRYVDDAIISSIKYIPMSNLAPIFSKVGGMFLSKGVKLNRNKIEITTSGHKMLVHNLNINSGTLSVNSAERSRVRAAVRQCENTYSKSPQSQEYLDLWRSTWGRVQYLKQFHPSNTKKYVGRLEDIRPIN